MISTQVLQEFYVDVTRKIGQPPDLPTAHDILPLRGHWEVGVPDVAMVLRVPEVRQRAGLSFRAALTVAAAAAAGADLLVTGDLDHGQRIEGIRARNPFAGTVTRAD